MIKILGIYFLNLLIFHELITAATIEKLDPEDDLGEEIIIDARQTACQLLKYKKYNQRYLASRRRRRDLAFGNLPSSNLNFTVTDHERLYQQSTWKKLRNFNQADNNGFLEETFQNWGVFFLEFW